MSQSLLIGFGDTQLINILMSHSLLTEFSDKTGNYIINYIKQLLNRVIYIITRTHQLPN